MAGTSDDISSSQEHDPFICPILAPTSSKVLVQEVSQWFLGDGERQKSFLVQAFFGNARLVAALKSGGCCVFVSPNHSRFGTANAQPALGNLHLHPLHLPEVAYFGSHISLPPNVSANSCLSGNKVNDSSNSISNVKAIAMRDHISTLKEHDSKSTDTRRESRINQSFLDIVMLSWMVWTHIILVHVPSTTFTSCTVP